MSNTKTVWKIRDASTTTANKSPLEEGVWHIPAGTTEVEPPSFNSETHTCSFNGTSWVVAAIPTPEPEPEEWEKMKFDSKAEYDATQYSRDRRTEYPSIGDQLDMIYHNGDGGATFQAAIKAVKDKYPKP
jgi:hypothetical protein